MRYLPIALLLSAVPVAASAESAREALTQAALGVRDMPGMLTRIAAAETDASATLARAPNDAEARMTRALAASYRAKLTRARGDALAARAQLEALVARDPRDPEAQLALGAWHVNAVDLLGRFVARAAVGARAQAGLDAADRAVALGGNRALFPALAGMLRLTLDPADARGAALVEAGARGATPTALDRVLRGRAAQLAAMIKGGGARGGDAKAVQSLARRLQPLGQFE